MDSEIGVLTREQSDKIHKLLSSSNTYEIENLDELLLPEIDYFTQSKEHLFNIYNFRLNNTMKLTLRNDLKWLLDNIHVFKGYTIRVSFIGSEKDRVLIFSDVEINILMGIVSKPDSMIVKRK